MARMEDPHSAASQFYINLKDNSSLNYAGPRNPGYCAFGKGLLQHVDERWKAQGGIDRTGINEAHALASVVRNVVRCREPSLR